MNYKYDLVGYDKNTHEEVRRISDLPTMVVSNLIGFHPDKMDDTEFLGGDLRGIHWYIEEGEENANQE